MLRNLLEESVVDDATLETLGLGVVVVGFLLSLPGLSNQSDKELEILLDQVETAEIGFQVLEFLEELAQVIFSLLLDVAVAVLHDPLLVGLVLQLVFVVVDCVSHELSLHDFELASLGVEVLG